VVIDGKVTAIKADMAIIVPGGVRHNVRNIGDKPLKSTPCTRRLSTSTAPYMPPRRTPTPGTSISTARPRNNPDPGVSGHARLPKRVEHGEHARGQGP
jgi:hypothetical protein